MTHETEKDWESATFEGNCRAQLRRARALTLRQRFEAVEELADISRRFAEMRQSGKLVAPK